MLIDALDEVLTTCPRTLRTHTHRRLTAMGVEILLGTMADAVDASDITVKAKDGRTERINSHTLIWAAGVHASPLAAKLGQAAGVGVDHKERVSVRADCSLPGHPEVFVIGDMANLDNLPGLSEPTIQERRYVAKVLRHKATGTPAPGPFAYRNLDTIATISPRDAIADIFGLKLRGRIGKLAWATVHIAFLVGWGNRVGVLLRWAFLPGSRTHPARAILTAVHDSSSRPPNSPVRQDGDSGSRRG